MSWQIIEDQEKLVFTRFFDSTKIFMTIELDHSALSTCTFSGEVLGPNNEFIASCTSPTFYGCMDRLLNCYYTIIIDAFLFSCQLIF